MPTMKNSQSSYKVEKMPPKPTIYKGFKLGYD